MPIKVPQDGSTRNFLKGLFGIKGAYAKYCMALIISLGPPGHLTPCCKAPAHLRTVPSFDSHVCCDHTSAQKQKSVGKVCIFLSVLRGL